MTTFSPNRKALLGILFAALLVLAAVPAMAQSGNAGGESAQKAGQEQFDDQTLETFASVSVELGNLQREFSQQLKSVQDRQKAMKLQKKMNQKMVKIVRDNGMDVQGYNAIANQLSADPELKSKVDKMVQEERAAN